MRTGPLPAILSLLLPLAVAPLAAQERIVTVVQRTHTDASFSPNGAWIAYQGGGKLFVQRTTGGGELTAFNAGQKMTYLWDLTSASLLVFSKDELFRTSRDGNTTKRLAKLDGQGVQDLFKIGPTNVWLYGFRRVGFKTIVIRVRLSDGKLEDLISIIPGVSSVDIDPSGQRLLITAAEFLFTYRFFTADLDGKNVQTVNTKALQTNTDHGRWIDGGKNFVFSHAGLHNTKFSAAQVWQMATATGTGVPLTWLPNQLQGVPNLSKDLNWTAIPELRPGQGTSRAVVMPVGGGGLTLLSGLLYGMDRHVRFSPNGQSVIYVGHALRNKGTQVRIYDMKRRMTLAPAARPGKTSQLSLPIDAKEIGVVFLGFALSATPIKLPHLTGQFDLDPTKGLLLLAAGVNQELKAPFPLPNDAGFVGLPLYLQGLRILFGGSRGDFTRPMVVPVVPN